MADAPHAGGDRRLSLLGETAARHANQFTYAPIIEVAVLFLGIFLTMIPGAGIFRSAWGVPGGQHASQVFLDHRCPLLLLDNAQPI